jgi:hypothetical protein
MTFSKALEHLKKGRSITRRGWHGKHAYLYLAKFGNAYEPCIVMVTSEGKHQPGWLASQADLLADDWSMA